MRIVPSLVVLVACGRDPYAWDRSIPPLPHDTTATSPSDTGTTLPVDGIRASCAVTDNALRVRCVVELDEAAPVRVRFAPIGGGDERVRASERAATHELLLVLLAPETTYSFVAEVPGTDLVAEGTFTTGAVPDDVASGELQTTGASSAPYLATHAPCDSRPTAVIYDTATGDVVWYDVLAQDGGLGFMDMIRYDADGTVLAEYGNGIVRKTLTGDVLLDLRSGRDYHEGLHHDLFERNGFVYAIFQDTTETPGLDGFLVFDRDGDTVAEWRARDALPFPADETEEFMHTNSIFVDPAGDVYLSSFLQNTVLAIAGDWTRPDFGTLRWALAGDEPAGFGQDFAIDWSIVVEDGFREQHTLTRLDDGRLLMLDNAHGRGLVLSLDEARGTARAEAEYPTGGSCGPQGTAAVTPAGNVLVGCSMEGELREYTPAGQEVWSARVECGGGPPTSTRFYPLDLP